MELQKDIDLLLTHLPWDKVAVIYTILQTGFGGLEKIVKFLAGFLLEILSIQHYL